MDPKNVQSLAFAAVFGVFAVLLTLLLAPFFTILLWSIFLYILFSPLYRFLIGGWKKEARTYSLRRRLLAAGFSLLSVLCIIGPLGFIALRLLQQVISIVSEIRRLVETQPDLLSLHFGTFIAEPLRQLSMDFFDLTSIDIRREIIRLLQNSTSALLYAATSLITNLGLFLLSLSFMVFTLYFFFVDGDYLLNLFVRAIPIQDTHLRSFIIKFRDTARHLFQGYFLVSLYQGVMAFILFSAFSVRHSLVLSFLVFLCSFIPMLGAGSIWGPVGIAMLIQGELPRGLLFLALSGFFISTVDNYLRPLFLGDRIKIHPLLIFFSILGGLAVFGFNGLILGPMIIMLFFTALDIFIELYQIDKERGPER